LALSEQFTNLRLVAALPSRASFGGHDFDFATLGIETFRKLGVAVCTLDGDEWGHPSRRADLVSRLRDFAPHFAIGVPNAGYGLQYTSADGENLFADILSIPLVLPWDHLLTQAPGYYLGEYQYEYQPTAGMLARLAGRLGHPRYRHYSPDSAHVEIYEALGLLGPGTVKLYQPSALTQFLEVAKAQTSETIQDRVAFAGNVYANVTLPFLQDPVLRELDDALIRAKREYWDTSGWHLLCYLLEQVPETLRERRGLSFDHRYFWHVASQLLSVRVSTAFRLEVLSAVRQPVDFYGNFASEGGGAALLGCEHITYCGKADFIGDLPKLYSKYAIWIDATNAPFIRGCGAKVLDCFASGSMMLVDYREDLRRELGEIAERFMYRNADELRTKVTYFLARPKERTELVESIRTVIRDKLSWSHYCARVCADMQVELMT